MKKRMTIDIFSIALLAVSLLFYLFFGILDGAIQWPDSATYIQMSIMREPLYPLFLAVFRAIVGPAEKVYLMWAVIVQCIITAFCSWSLVTYLYKRLSLNRPLTALLLCVPFGVSLLTRFAAGRQSMYSNGIFSEALALPLFFLFIRYLYAYLLDAKKSDLVVSCILSFMMISIRKQMAISIFLIVLVLFCEVIRTRQIRKFLLRAVIAAVSILCGAVLLDRAYNYCLHDENTGHSGSGRFLTTMVLYTAEREYGELIEDEIAREIFYGIYDECDAAGYLKDYADDGWYDRQSHFESHYDHIQINTLMSHVNANVVSRIPDGEVVQAQETDRLISEMTYPLLTSCLPSILSCFFDNFLSGLVTTNAVKRPLFVTLSILLYLAYIALWIVLRLKNGRSKATDFALLTLCSIVINVGAVSCLIFCQSRYTIYNMALFYISGLLMLHEGWGVMRRK